MGKVFKMA